jgi:hypothetical protein
MVDGISDPPSISDIEHALLTNQRQTKEIERLFLQVQQLQRDLDGIYKRLVPLESVLHSDSEGLTLSFEKSAITIHKDGAIDIVGKPVTIRSLSGMTLSASSSIDIKSGNEVKLNGRKIVLN